MNEHKDEEFDELEIADDADVVETVPAEETYEEYDYVELDALKKQLRPGIPAWAVVLIVLGSLAAGALGSAFLGLGAYLTPDTATGQAITSEICVPDAPVRAEASPAGAIVDRLSFGDEVSGNLKGAWLLIGEGRYVAAQALCEVDDGTQDEVAGGVTEESTTTTTTTTETSTTQVAGEDEAATTAPNITTYVSNADDPGRIDGTLVVSGEGTARMNLPQDVRAGLLYVQNDGPGDLTLSGVGLGEEENAAAPAMTLTDGSSGYDIFGVGADMESVTVTTDGSWSVRISPLSSVAIMEASIAGTGPMAFFVGDEGGRWVFTPTGQARLIEHFPDGTTASATIEGPSAVTLAGGGSYLTVYTNDVWTGQSEEPVEAPDGDGEEQTQAP